MSLANLKTALRFRKDSADRILLIRTTEERDSKAWRQMECILFSYGYLYIAATPATMDDPHLTWDIGRLLTHAQSYRDGSALPITFPRGPIAILLSDSDKDLIDRSSKEFVDLWNENMEHVCVVQV